MDTDSKIINTNSIAFIGLANEYCAALENVRETMREDFVTNMLRLLPRLYITATDLTVNMIPDEEPYISPALEEDYYDSVRLGVEQIMGPDDVYLEVFEEDMKYSDTPVSASISEGLTDIFQVLYNFLSCVKDAPDHLAGMALLAVQEDFKNYWSQILCNTLRAVNNLEYNSFD